MPTGDLLAVAYLKVQKFPGNIPQLEIQVSGAGVRSTPGERYKKHTIEVIVDRLKVSAGIEQRLAESFETAVQMAEGIAKSLGFETIVIEGATLPVDIGDYIKNTLKCFKNKGIHYGQLDKFI